jgi:predicted metal-dependent hydrolase of the TIM-barrel fold
MRSAKDSIEFLAPLANVFTDTAFSSQYVPLSAGREVIEAFGAERVLFGTDCPWDTPARTLAYLKAMRLPPLWEEKIFYGNALQILED